MIDLVYRNLLINDRLKNRSHYPSPKEHTGKRLYKVPRAHCIVLVCLSS